jgi:peptidoglycan/xylan/chitin deacetylase (PgdA/CDA1 family)
VSKRKRGAFIISLDFELHWGFFDRRPLDAPAKRQLSAAREAAGDLLDLFEERKVHATWAAVGLLLPENREARRELRPALLPRYERRELDPYAVEVGENEEEDPWHYAASIARRIAAVPGQEPATHTYGHYYCLEEGQDEASFEADLRSAVEAGGRLGARPVSIIFPRNQHKPAYDDILRRWGIRAYRGNPAAWCYAEADERKANMPFRRALRLLDAYLPLVRDLDYRWEEAHCGAADTAAGAETEAAGTGPCNFRASRFLRPYSQKFRLFEPLRLKRICGELEAAARDGKIYHLWWHPHNFAAHRAENMAFLCRVLDRFEKLRRRFGMESLSMGEAAQKELKEGPERATSSGGA